jgi:hypothetical protein
MTTKLHIDISQGVIDIEGDPDLAREIYADFKDQLLNRTRLAASPPASTPDLASSGRGDGVVNVASKAKAKRRPARKTNGEEGGSGVVADSPKLDKNLNTASLGPFYGQFLPKNNAEKNPHLFEIYNR